MPSAVADLLGLAVALTAIVDGARVVSIGADVVQRRAVTECLVDARQLITTVCGRAGDVDCAGALAVAVAAGAVDLAVVLDVVVDAGSKAVSSVFITGELISREAYMLTVPQPLCWMTLSSAW